MLHKNGDLESSLIKKAKEYNTQNEQPANLWEWTIERTILQHEKFFLYAVMTKLIPPNAEDENHNKVMKVKKVTNEKQFDEICRISQIRKKLSDIENQYIIYYDCDTFVFRSSGLYHIAIYDDPDRNCYNWIKYDHVGVKISMLYVFYILKDIVGALDYLEKSNLILTQLNLDNIYAGSISEDRFTFIKLYFKGYQVESLPDMSFDPNKVFPRDMFAPPETDGNNPHKSNLFQLGIVTLWCILTNHSLEFDGAFYRNTPENAQKLKDYINTAAGKIEGCPDSSKQEFINFMSLLLTYDVSKRPSPRQMLEHNYIQLMRKADEEDFQRQLAEYKKAEANKQEEAKQE